MPNPVESPRRALIDETATAIPPHHTHVMRGRDPLEPGRVATPLELLFDLTFVTAFGMAAAQFAQTLSNGHVVAALIGFGFATFSICWAWSNFTWFASAFDTDDWIFRLATMVQMIGVLVLALGLPALFSSLERGQRLDNVVMVSGYVIMRAAMIFQWLRASRHPSPYRRTCLTYAALFTFAQAGWVAFALLRLPPAADAVLIPLLAVAELSIPALAERIGGETPWHARHIAERHGLLAMIALGEGVVGAVATTSAVVERGGWTLDAALVAVAGIALTFGLWWTYYIIPSAQVLQVRRRRARLWGHGQMILVAAIVSTGAGLDVVADHLEHSERLGSLDTLLCVAVPVALYFGTLYVLYAYLMSSLDRFHLWLLTGTIGVLLLSALAAIAGLAFEVCLLIITSAPAVTVIGYELVGYRHQQEALIRAPIARR